MALTDLTRISTSGIATGSTIDAPILRKDVHFRGTQVGVNSALFDSSDDELKFQPNTKLSFGGTALQIYHGSNVSHIAENGTGPLRLSTDEFQVMNSAQNKTMIYAAQNLAVSLNYNGNTKIQTTNHGAVVTGILTASGFSGPLSNPSGISTFYDLRVTNNLTVEGTTSTLDTTLIGVDRVEVGANSNSIVGVAVTQSGTADLVNLFDGATKVVTVDDVGNVGLGTDNPDRMLHIKGTGNAIVKMEANYSGSVTGIEGVLTASGANRYVTGVYGKVVNTSGSESNVASIRLWNEQASPTTSDSPGYITFNTTNDGASTATEKLRITSAGHLGVGDNNPDTRLSVKAASGTDVVGKFTSTDANAWIQFRDNTTTDTAVMVGANGDNLLLRAGSNERLRITSSGEVNIGGNYAQTTYNTQITTGSVNKKISFGAAAHNDFSDEGSGIFFSRQSDGSSELSGIFAHTNTSLGLASRGNITFHAGGTSTYGAAPERLRIDSNGYMGLGTILASDAGSGGAGLKIEKYVQRNNIYAFPDGWYGASLGEVQNTENKVWASIDSHYNRTSAISAGLFLSAFHADAGGSGCGSAIKNLKTGNALTFSTVTTGASVGSVAVETERLRIKADGKVGIGTDNPSFFTHIQADGVSNDVLKITANGAGQMVNIQNRSNVASIVRFANYLANAFWDVQYNTDNSFALDYGDSEKFRITSDGKIGIGNIASPSNNIEIRTTAHGQGVTIKSTGDTSNALTFDANRGAGGVLGVVYGRWNGTTVAQMSFISGEDGTDKNDGYITFGTETAASNGNVNATEKFRITTHGGTVVNKGGSPNAASGWAGLEVKAAASEHQLVLSSTDTASNSNQVRLGFKLHPSNDNERVKAAIVCQGSGGGYGEVSRMMFCIDSAADNGNALPNSASDEKLRITSSGLIQIGGDISNVADIDTSNTKLTIKQSANNPEDGIYIERSGERRGHYIYVGGAHGVNDGLCFGTNQLGGHTDILALDRSGAAYLGGSFYPNGDANHDIGSEAKTWRKFYIRNMYPDQGTEYRITSGSYSNGQWHDTAFRRDYMGNLDLNGVYIVTAYADLYNAMGGNYSCNYTWIVGMRNQYTNQTLVNTCPLLSVTGHSTNNYGASGATVGDGIRLGTRREPAASGSNEYIVWRPAASTSAINNTAGRTLVFRVQRIGRSSLG